AVAKRRQRAQAWSGNALGLQFSAMVYNVCCFSALLFLAQLEPILEEVAAQEEEVLLGIATGRRCFAPCTLRLGTPCRLTWTGNLLACSTPPFFIFWRRWYQKSFVSGLVRNADLLATRGIAMANLRTRFCKGADVERDRKMLKTNFQREASKLNPPRFLGCWGARLACELKRWRLQESRHTLVRRRRDSLQRLGDLVAPRVAAAAWGLAWNRWCTARRHQGERACVLRCGASSDSIEHYVGCAVGRAAGGRFLRLHGDCARHLRRFLGVARCTDDAERTCWAVLAHALHMVTNRRRYLPEPPSGGAEVAIQEEMQQCRGA
ncbi:unnamed protein product, partial [Prorocentrum cordatum]